MRLITFIISIFLSGQVQSAASICPLCDISCKNDQTALLHIDTACLIANPQLNLQSHGLSNQNYRIAAKTLHVLQNYIFKTMHHKKTDILTPQHAHIQQIAQNKLKAIIDEINMPQFCKEQASELLLEMHALLAKARYRAHTESLNF